jgi:plastocyanin
MALSELLFALGVLAAMPLSSAAQEHVDVQARLAVVQAGSHKTLPKPASANVAIWLNPDPAVTRASLGWPAAPGRFRMEQSNKNFNPHLLVVPVGSAVEFPNLDPFFHNVFSQFNGKRFDLGLYEAGSTRVVRFDHEGISYLFCNIHSEMAAVIITLRTPYYAIAKGSGPVDLREVPPGDYEMHVWAEGADAKELEALSRRVHITSSQTDMGTIQITVPGSLPPHKNKFGDDYKSEPVQSY